MSLKREISRYMVITSFALNVSIVNSSMSLATLQVMQDNSSVHHFAQIRSIKITENKTTIILTGNKETANVFSKVLGTNAPNVNIVEIPEDTKKENK